MAWRDDRYVRELLDTRERWGVLLSLTAIAAMLVFLAENPHRAWVKAAPLALGVLGSLYVLLVNCYYEQAEEIANAATDDAREDAKRARALAFAGRVGILGRLHIVAPVLVGALASLTLWFGLTG